MIRVNRIGGIASQHGIRFRVDSAPRPSIRRSAAGAPMCNSWERPDALHREAAEPLRRPCAARRERPAAAGLVAYEKALAEFLIRMAAAIT